MDAAFIRAVLDARPRISRVSRFSCAPPKLAGLGRTIIADGGVT
jgi:hypothetical protein